MCYVFHGLVSIVAFEMSDDPTREEIERALSQMAAANGRGDAEPSLECSLALQEVIRHQCGKCAKLKTAIKDSLHTITCECGCVHRLEFKGK